MLARLLGQENPANWWHKWNTIKAINGTRTFGEINLDGPDQGADPSSVHTLGLRFKFVRHDTGQPVNIAWMQFSLFDFDHTNGKKQEGQEARATGAPPPTETRNARNLHKPVYRTRAVLCTMDSRDSQ